MLDERIVARDTLILVARHVNESLTSFVGWLAVGVGGAFSIFIGNIDKVERFIELSSIQYALEMLSVALFLAVLVRLLSALVSGSVAAHDSGAKIAAEILATKGQFDIVKFQDEYMRGLYPPSSWAASWAFRRVSKEDLAASGRMVAAISQFMTFIVFLLIIFIFAAALTLVFGVKKSSELSNNKVLTVPVTVSPILKNGEAMSGVGCKR